MSVDGNVPKHRLDLLSGQFYRVGRKAVGKLQRNVRVAMDQGGDGGDDIAQGRKIDVILTEHGSNRGTVVGIGFGDGFNGDTAARLLCCQQVEGDTQTHLSCGAGGAEGIRQTPDKFLTHTATVIADDDGEQRLFRLVQLNAEMLGTGLDGVHGDVQNVE